MLCGRRHGSSIAAECSCHWTGSGVSRFDDKLIRSSFGDLGDGISQEIHIEVWGSWRCDISRDIAKTCTHLRLVIRGQRPMTPTVTSWVWQVIRRESEARYNRQPVSTGDQA